MADHNEGSGSSAHFNNDVPDCSNNPCNADQTCLLDDTGNSVCMTKVPGCEDSEDYVCVQKADGSFVPFAKSCKIANCPSNKYCARNCYGYYCIEKGGPNDKLCKGGCDSDKGEVCNTCASSDDLGCTYSPEMKRKAATYFYVILGVGLILLFIYYKRKDKRNYAAL